MPKFERVVVAEAGVKPLRVSFCLVPKPEKAGVEAGVEAGVGALKVSWCFVPKTERGGA